MSFEEQFEKDMQSYGNNTEYFKPKNGNNVIRVMAEPVKEVSRFGKGICFEGAPYCTEESLAASPDKEGNPAKLQVRYTTWVLDRADGKFKIYSMPIKVTKLLVGYKTDTDGGWSFDEFPMPYDINVQTKRAGTKKVEYIVLPIKKESKITEDEMEAFNKLTPMDKIMEKKKARAKREYEGEGDQTDDSEDEAHDDDTDEPTIRPEDIPF